MSYNIDQGMNDKSLTIHFQTEAQSETTLSTGTLTSLHEEPDMTFAQGIPSSEFQRIIMMYCHHHISAGSTKYKISNCFLIKN